MGKIGEFGNREYSPKFSSLIFTDTLKMYLAYALIVAYSPNFCLPIDLPEGYFLFTSSIVICKILTVLYIGKF